MNYRISLQIATLVIICVFYSSVAVASIQKSDLRIEVETSIRQGLLKQVSDKNEVGEAKKRVAFRAARLAETINQLKVNEIDDELAAWIRESFNIVTHPSWRFSEDYGPVNLSFDHFVRQAEKVLSELDNELGKTRLVMRDKYLREAVSYRDSLRKLIFEEFASAKSFTINLGTNINGVILGTDSLIGIVGALGITLNATDSPILSYGNSIDVSNEILDSHLLTLAMVRLLKKTFEEQAEIFEVAFNNLFFGIYDSNDPMNISELKKFEDVADEIRGLIGDCTDKQNSKITINWRCFESNLNRSFVVHSSYVEKDSPAFSHGETPNQKYSYITFKNNIKTWELFK